MPPDTVYPYTVAFLLHHIYPGNEASLVEKTQMRGKRKEETRWHIQISRKIHCETACQNVQLTSWLWIMFNSGLGWKHRSFSQQRGRNSSNKAYDKKIFFN